MWNICHLINISKLGVAALYSVTAHHIVLTLSLIHLYSWTTDWGSRPSDWKCVCYPLLVWWPCPGPFNLGLPELGSGFPLLGAQCMEICNLVWHSEGGSVARMQTSQFLSSFQVPSPRGAVGREKWPQSCYQPRFRWVKASFLNRGLWTCFIRCWAFLAWKPTEGLGDLVGEKLWKEGVSLTLGQSHCEFCT